jgi:hypothetical protein
VDGRHHEVYTLPYHAGGAQTCLDAYSAAYSDAAITLDEKNAIATACLGAFSRTGGKHTACGENADCDGSQGLRCILKGDVGTCQIPQDVMPGMDCSNTNAVCGNDLYCDSNQHCVAKQSVGKACSNTLPCESKSICGPAMSCVAKKANAETCENDSECLGGFCIKAPGQKMGSCGAKLTLGPNNGDSCALFKP